jgi:outer membrane protein
MKQFSLALNVILLAAVIGLYVKVFSKPKPQVTSTTINKNDTSQTSITTTGPSPIAYIELDSLNEQIVYIKEHRKDLEREQKGIEAEWKGAMTNLQNKVSELQKNAGSRTQQEGERIQNELMRQQQEIEGRKQTQTQVLSEKSYVFLEEIQKELKKYVAEYNKDKNYQYILTTGSGNEYMIFKNDANNITNDIIKGMNEVMKSKK